MTLVSVIGDFHSSVLPVYYFYRHKISNHIVIYDDFKYDSHEAKNIIKGTKKFNKKHNLDIKTFAHCIDEDNFDAIQKVVQFIQEKFNKKKELIINITDGLSSLNTIVGLRLLPLGAKLLSYDRYDNQCNLITQTSMQTFSLDKGMSIEDHFLLKNLSIECDGDISFAKQNQALIINLFEKNLEEYKKFTKYTTEEINPSLKNPVYPAINDILLKLGVKNLKREKSFVTGGLFELYIYLKLRNLPFDDIKLNVKVYKHLDDKYYIPNEFDILIMKNNHLHIVECKFSQTTPLDELVYKYISLKNLVDDDGKVAIITRRKTPLDIYTHPSATAYSPYKRARANSIHLLEYHPRQIDTLILDIKKIFNLE